MRKERREELQKYIHEFQTKKKTLLSSPSTFVTIEKASYELNNGKKIIREKILKNKKDGNAVIILPVTKEKEMLLIVEPRVCTKSGVGVGFPAGYVEENETVEEAARRELLEETGYQAEAIETLGGYYQDEGCSSAYNTIVLATGCVKVNTQKLDDSEFIHYFLCTIEESYEMLDNNVIAGVNSQMALLKAEKILRK